MSHFKKIRLKELFLKYGGKKETYAKDLKLVQPDIKSKVNLRFENDKPF